MHEELKPYLQGRLDGMCGIYSTINAFRTACAKAGYRSHIAWRDVFQGCLERLELRWKLKDLVPYGLTSYQHSLCIHYVRSYLRRSTRFKPPLNGHCVTANGYQWQQN